MTPQTEAESDAADTVLVGRMVKRCLECLVADETYPETAYRPCDLRKSAELLTAAAHLLERGYRGW